MHTIHLALPPCSSLRLRVHNPSDNTWPHKGIAESAVGR